MTRSASRCEHGPAWEGITGLSASLNSQTISIDVHGNESGYAVLLSDEVTGGETPVTPQATYLEQNYPNPFNPATMIAFGLKEQGPVSLRIYDAAGRQVRVLVNEAREAARYEEIWDGRDDGGRAVASGIYFYHLTTGGRTQSRKMLLLR